MVVPPPPEFLEEIRDLYHLEFVPIPFAEKETFEDALRQTGHEPGNWSDEAWDEYENNDSILSQDTEGKIYRFLRTITILVMRVRERGKPDIIVHEYLDETVEWPDGRASARTYGTRSLSEKIQWRDNGVWKTRLIKWRILVRRAIFEELRIRLNTWQLSTPWLCRVEPSVWYSEVDEIGPVVAKENDPKRPGIITYNYLYHAYLRLAKRHWRDEYRERKYRNNRLVKTLVHRWRLAPAPT